MKRALVTGGAGFIGAHLTAELLRHGYAVRLLDSFEPQVHGDALRQTVRGQNGDGALLRPPVPAHAGQEGDQPLVTATAALDLPIAEPRRPTRRPGSAEATFGLFGTRQGAGRSGADQVLPLPGLEGKEVETIRGDVRDRAVVDAALEDVDVVFHLAARVGVGQSMYRIHDYVDANAGGTAVLMEALVDHPVDRLVVASSMSVYGEGLYQAPDGRLLDDVVRGRPSRAVGWDPATGDGTSLEPVPTPEWKNVDLASVYALSKYDQERLCLLVGDAYGIPTTALRLFNVYGAGQALGNPYTGVLAIFASQILNGRHPRVYEDGEQQRDFVHVSDVARAFRLAATAPRAVGRTLNIGSGHPRSVRQVANALLGALERPDLRPEVTHKYRKGDVRHCFADVSLAREILGLEDQVPLEAGLREWVRWVRDQVAEDRTADADKELIERGLLS